MRVMRRRSARRPSKKRSINKVCRCCTARPQLIGQRTQLINAVRGHLSELGIVAARGLLGLAELAAIARDESDQRLPATYDP
jgi:transposase